MSSPSHAAVLTSMLALWPEGSPQRAAIDAAIQDTERLDKVERLNLDIEYSISAEWDVIGYDGTSTAATLRAAIDGVPE